MKARLSPTALDSLVSWPQVVDNFLGQVVTVFSRVHFNNIVSTKFFGFI